MSTEPEPHFDWESTVSEVYATVISEADPEVGTTRQEAMQIAADRLLELIDSGDLKPDLLDVVKRALSHADTTHGKLADKLIAATADGTLTLFDSEEELNTVVTLGGGRRKLWRNVNEEDLTSMDELRYKNVVAQQDSYKIWRAAFETTRRGVRAYRTIEHAIESGAFSRESLGGDAA